jgi:hypothetical protein
MAALLRLKITPNAPASAVTGETDGVIRLKLQAPAVKGKANAALVAFPLASSVNTPSSMALSRVFEPQKPMPSCMILSGAFFIAAVSRDALATERAC